MLAIVDYQMGNLRSVQKGFERVGHEATITSDAREIAAADKVVLPGVGGFADAMAELKRRDLITPLADFVAAGKPFLGICLGLQLLFEGSDEDGDHEGFGWLKGRVKRFAPGPERKVPHMGWNTLTFTGAVPLFAGLADGTYVYFVHSYYADASDPNVVAATADYPEPFCAAIARDNLYATQFHPEKSQRCGLKILDNFAML